MDEQESNNFRIVYKAATAVDDKGRARKVIVTLAVGLNVENTFSRDNVVNKDCAKFRVRSARVITIADLSGNKYKAAVPRYYRDGRLVYRVGHTVEAPKWDPNPTAVCAPGIHVFLEPTAAALYEADSSAARGSYITVYDNGVRSEKGFRDESGRLQGRLRRWYPNGQLAMECSYKDGLLDGYCEEHHENGKKKAWCFYTAGKKDGCEETRYENGSIKSKASYSAGHYVGVTEKFYENGQLKEVANWDSDGFQEGEYVAYHENGEKAESVCYKRGCYEGECLLWFVDGTLAERAFYVGGKMEGLFQRFTEEGLLVMELSSAGGLIHGPYKKWTDGGRLLEEIYYVAGRPRARKIESLASVRSC